MTKRMRLFVALFAVFALFAAACGDSDGDGSGSGSDDDTTQDSDSSDTDAGTSDSGDSDDAADADTDTTEAMEAPAEPAGGSLVIGTSQVARHLNGLVQSGLATAVPGSQVFASPLLVDADYNFSPYLAESWDISDDGLAVTLNLTSEATFHDGMPITSADVAFSIEVSKANHPFRTMFGPVTTVDTPDATTVVINLSQPHPAILLALTPPLLPIIPKHIFDDGQDMSTHPRNGEDVIGSGPFKVVEFNPSEVIRLERNEDFWLGPAQLDEIIIQTFPDSNSIVLALEAGEIDSASISSATDIARLQGVDGLTVTPDGHHGLGAVNWVEFNTANDILSDANVRKAIALAIDRDFITDTLMQGIFEAAPSPIAPSSPFFNAGIETYDLDVETARGLLADAGYADGDISLEIDYIPGPDAIQKNIAEYIVQALEDVGIDLSLRVSPDFPTWAGRISSGDFDMTMNNVWNWGDPVIGVHRTYLSSNRVGVIWTNNTDYENAEVDALLDQAGQAVDLDERIALYADFQDLVAADLPIYWLNNTTFWQAFPADMQNPPLGIWGTMSPMHEIWLDR
ncbi:MAG: ABC transporter substrate-binding protein [Acidimicrobiales bacterium]